MISAAVASLLKESPVTVRTISPESSLPTSPDSVTSATLALALTASFSAVIFTYLYPVISAVPSHSEIDVSFSPTYALTLVLLNSGAYIKAFVPPIAVIVPPFTTVLPLKPLSQATP